MKTVVSNLDCEYAWWNPQWVTPKAVQSKMDAWSAILRLLPGHEKALIGDVTSTGELTSWGLDPRLGHDVDATVRVNSKIFSVAMENEFGVGIGATCAESIDAIIELTSQGHWLVKHPFGVSGRERAEVTDGNVDRAHVSRLLTRTPVIVEPFLNVSKEWSTQFDITDEGVVMLGSLYFDTDSRGQHRGHWLNVPTPPHLEEVTWAAQRVFEDGYRGPCGIDSLEGDLGGNRVVRPIGEINARYTFGRMALELRRHLGDEPAFWWHPPARHVLEVPELEVDPDRANGVFRLPDVADPQGRSGSVVISGVEEILRVVPARHTVILRRQGDD